MRNVLIVFLLIVVVMLGRTLVRVENERYALWLGMCPNLNETLGAVRAGARDPWKCVKAVETRTGWWWHLYYAISNSD